LATKKILGAGIDWLEDVCRPTPDRPRRIPKLDASAVEWKPPRHFPPDDCGVFHGGRRVCKRTNAHTLLVSTTRGGKSTLMRLMMQDILPDVDRPVSNVRAVIYDPKGETYDLVAGMGLESALVTLDPFDVRSFAWDMCRDVKSQKSAKNLARILVPEAKGAHTSDGFFRRVLRLLITHVVHGFIKIGKPWTFRHVLTAMDEDEVLKQVALRSPAARNDLKRIFRGRQETLNDILVTIAEQLQDYRIIASLWDHARREGRTFSIADWHRTQRILILPAPEDDTEQSDSSDSIACLNRMLFALISQVILKGREAHAQAIPPRTWIFLDELRFAGRLPGLTKLLTMGASKGARVVVAFQDISGLRVAVGKDNAEEIASLCANQAFLRAGCNEMAQWMVSQFGKERVTQREVTTSTTGESTAYRRVEQTVLLDSDFLNLPLPNPDPPYGDLEGYFKTAEHGLWHARLSVRKLFDEVLIPPKRPGHLESEALLRPDRQQELEPWTDEDSRYFGLAISPPSRGRVKSPPRLAGLGLFQDPAGSQ